MYGTLSNVVTRVRRAFGHTPNIDWFRVRLNRQVTIDHANAAVAIAQLESTLTVELSRKLRDAGTIPPQTLRSRNHDNIS